MSRNIYYLCPNTKMMFGGVKKIYEHVDILNKLGFSAYILHSEFGMRCDWFENRTPIAYADAIYEAPIVLGENGESRLLPPISEEDIVVIPETVAHQVAPHTLKLGQYFVIFNQNAYLTFHELSLAKTPFLASKEDRISPYCSKNLLGTIVVSQDIVDYLHYTFPELESIYRVNITIDFNKFSYQENKKKLIAFMPRKRKTHSLQVINILRQRNKLKDWIFIPIQDMTEIQVAETLKESAIFLSFCKTEGFPLPPLEAMACGCIVIGYDGQGGRETLHKPYAYPIDDCKIVDFAKTVESIALNYEVNPDLYKKQGRLASDFIQSTYTKDREENDLKTIWTAITQRHAIEREKSRRS